MPANLSPLSKLSRRSVLFAALFILSRTLTLSLAQDKPAPSQAPVKVTAPSQLFGLSFDQCEALLGKPLAAEEPTTDNRAISRIFKGHSSATSRIKVSRVPQGGRDGPLSSGVAVVIYYFPKGSVKTWEELFRLAGLEAANPARPKDFATPPEDKSVGFSVAGYRRILWQPSAESMKGPEGTRNPNEDALIFWAQRSPQ